MAMNRPLARRDMFAFIQLPHLQQHPYIQDVLAILRIGLEAVGTIIFLKRILTHGIRQRQPDIAQNFIQQATMPAPILAATLQRAPLNQTNQLQRPIWAMVRTLLNLYLILITQIMRKLVALLRQPAYLFDFGILTYWLSKLN